MPRAAIWALCVLVGALLQAPRASLAVAPANNTGKLELTLPEGATVAIDGEDYGDKRSFWFADLPPETTYKYALRITFPSQATTEHTILVKAGRKTCLALQDPKVPKPELVLQAGHSGKFTAATISRDGSHILTGSDDGSVILWDVATGRQLRLFKTPVLTGGTFGSGSEATHTAEIASVCLDPDGKWCSIAAKAEGGFFPSSVACIWNRKTGRKQNDFGVDGFMGITLALSRDGKRLLYSGVNREEVRQELNANIHEIMQQLRQEFPKLPFQQRQRLHDLGIHPSISQWELVKAITRLVPENPNAVIDLLTGRVAFGFPTSLAEVSTAAFSEDSKRVLLCCSEPDPRLEQRIAELNRKTERLQQSLATTFQNGENDRAQQIQRELADLFQERLAVANSAQVTQLWDLDARQMIGRIKTGCPAMRAELSPDGQTAVLTTGPMGPRGIRVWRLDTEEEATQRLAAAWKPADRESLGVSLAGFSSDSKQIFLADNRQLRFQAVDDGEVTETFRLDDFAKNQQIHSLGVSADGRRLLICSPREVALWDLKPVRQICRLRGNLDPLKSAGILPDGSGLVLGSCHWDAKSRETKKLLESDSAMWVCPTSKKILIDGSVWDFPTGKRLFSLNQFATPVVAAGFSGDGSRVFAAFGQEDTGLFSFSFFGNKERDGQIGIWDGNSGQELPHIDTKSHCRKAAFDSLGQRVAVAYVERIEQRRDGQPGSFPPPEMQPPRRGVAIWDLETRQKTRQLGEESATAEMTSCLAFHPQGKLLFVGYMDGQGVLWDSSTGEQVYVHKHEVPITVAAFSPDGKQLLLGRADRVASLWCSPEAGTVEELQTFVGHDGKISVISFSPDGELVLTASAEDGTSRLWDVATGKELARLVSLNNRKDSLIVTPEGLFDGSTGGRNSVAFRVGAGLKVVPVDRFFQDFWYPGLLDALWRGERPLPDVQLGDSQPPVVRITAYHEGEVVEDKVVGPRSVRVVVEAEDKGGGIAELKLF